MKKNGKVNIWHNEEVDLYLIYKMMGSQDKSLITDSNGHV